MKLCSIDCVFEWIFLFTLLCGQLEASTLHPAKRGRLEIPTCLVLTLKLCIWLFLLVTLEACLCRKGFLLEQKIVLSKACLNSGSHVC